MKKTILLLLLSIAFLSNAQPTYIKFNQLQHAASSTSCVVTGTDGALTYTPTFPVSKWTNDALYASRLSPTPVKTANYSVVAGDFVPCDVSGGSFTLTLPTAPIDGSMAEAKIINSNSVNVIVVKTGGSDVFNKTGGASSGTITLSGQAMVFQYKSSTAIWYVIGEDLPLNQLDARYTGTISGGYLPYTYTASPNWSGITTFSTTASTSTANGSHWFNTADGMVWGTNPVQANNGYNMTWTNGTMKGGLITYSTSPYAGIWFGTRTNDPLLLTTRIDGGGIPSLAISGQTTGALGCVLVNSSSYTSTAMLEVNSGGGTEMLSVKRSGTTHFKVSNIASGLTQLSHLGGLTSAPAIARGTGLGTGTGTVVSVTNASDLSGIIGVVTGTAALGTTATLATITFNLAYSAIPNVILTPANAAAANLITGVSPYVPAASTTTAAFILSTNTVALTASQTYSFYYQVIQQ